MNDLLRAVWPLFQSPGHILDVGSMDINGSHRSLVPAGWSYLGVDAVAGKGVDRIVPDHGTWNLNRRFDIVMSGQCIEHARRPWVLAQTMGEHLVDNGFLVLTAPFAWHQHRHPIDCWRFLPDGMRELLDIAGCDTIDAQLDGNTTDCGNEASPRMGMDCWAIGRRRKR